MINAVAPGKIVLWGEYAVLAGAPAAVLAVNRYAGCRLHPAPELDDWHIETRGFTSKPEHLPVARLSQRRDVLACALGALTAASRAALPAGMRVTLDTTAFYQGDSKLGLGSSAAVTTATYRALAALAGQKASFAGALSAHRALQGGAGSGIDVAAAWHGGCIRFENGTVQPLKAFDLEQWRFHWTGRAASTADHIARFRRWAAREPKELADLARACRRMLAVSSVELPDTMSEYAAALHRMDRAAGLGVYSGGHERLHKLAQAQGVVYKPCGAGGGDVGAAISDNRQALAAFSAAADDLGFARLAIDRAEHGVQISR